MNKYKKDFLIFEKYPDLVYLDSAATSLTPANVVDTLANYYNYERSTIHRGASKLVNYNDKRYNNTRKHLAKMFNCKFEEIIFDKSTTSIMNHLATNIINQLQVGDEIIISPLEHHSTLLAFRERAKQKGITISYAPVNNLQVDLDQLEKMVSKNTKVIVMHHVSNVIGDTIDLKRLAMFCHEHKIISVIDGAQGFLHEQIDVKNIPLDFYVFSAHKVFGPTGLGIMFGREELIKNYIFDYGGDMVEKVDFDQVIYRSLPQRLEAGTPAIGEIIAFNESLEFIENIGIDKINQHNLALANYAKKQLALINDVVVYNQDINTTLVIFNLKDISIHDAQDGYAKYDISLRGGQLCNALSLKTMDVDNVLRISFNIYNDFTDVDKFIEATKAILEDPLLWM